MKMLDVIIESIKEDLLNNKFLSTINEGKMFDDSQI